MNFRLRNMVTDMRGGRRLPPNGHAPGPRPRPDRPDPRGTPILERWARGRRVPRRLVRRARIILHAAAGLSNTAIARALRTDRECVGRWRARFAAQRLAGLQREAARPGRPPVIPAAVLHALGTLLTTSVGPNGRPWSCRALARDAGVSPATIHRLCQATGLAPHWVTAAAPAAPVPGVCPPHPGARRLPHPRGHRPGRRGRRGRPAPARPAGVGPAPGRPPAGRPAMPSGGRPSPGWLPGPPRRIGSSTGSSSWPTWRPGSPGAGGSTCFQTTR